ARGGDRSVRRGAARYCGRHSAGEEPGSDAGGAAGQRQRADRGHDGLQGIGRVVPRSHHVGRAPQAGDEPGTVAGDQCQDRPGRREASGGGLAQRNPGGGHQPAGCDDLRRPEDQQVPARAVVGMAGVLDSARLQAFIAAELKVSVDSVQTMVLGGHGDQMVPLIRHTTVAGVPLSEWLPKDRIDALVNRTREGGAEVVSLLKTGSAYYAPSASIVAMVDAIMLDSKKILPCAALCRGEYGVDGLFVGVPVKLGRHGVEEIVRLSLTKEEQAALAKSAASVKELCALVDRYL